MVKDAGAKWSAMTDLFDEMRTGPATTLYLDYSSGYKPLPFGVPNVPSVANALNPQLEGYLSSDQSSGRYGVVAMDFVDAQRAALVYRKNFR